MCIAYALHEPRPSARRASAASSRA
jgi:hypothetical protein